MNDRDKRNDTDAADSSHQMRKIREEAASLCRAYNRKLSRTYNAYLESREELPEHILFSDEQADFLRKEVGNAMAGWAYEKLELAEDCAAPTVAEWFSNLRAPDEIMLAFDVFAAGCDLDIPDPLKICLGRAADLVQGELQKRVLNKNDEEASCSSGAIEEGDRHLFGKKEDGERLLLIQLMAIRTLGEWEDLSIVQDLLSLLRKAEPCDERLPEAIHDYVKMLGERVLPEILAEIRLRLEEGQTNGDFSYLLIFAITANGKKTNHDLYSLLRQALLEMKENRVIAAICLGDLADGRAVSFLRGYINKGLAEMDRQLYAEILSSIKRLGGETKDLPLPSGLAQHLL